MRYVRVSKLKSLLLVACTVAGVVMIWCLWSASVCEFHDLQDETVHSRKKLLRTVVALPEIHYLKTTNGTSSNSTQIVLATKSTQTSQQHQVPLHLMKQLSDPDIIARGKSQGLQVQKFCQKYHFPDQFAALSRIGPSGLHEFYRHLIFSDEKELIYCFVPKHGCTNLKRLMLYTTGDIPLETLDWTWVEDTVYLEPALSRSSLLNASLTDAQRKKRINSYNKFMVVRNPLERLVSAFRDKMAPPVNYTLQWSFPHNVKVEILNTHRHLDYLKWKKAAGSFNLSVTFSNFIDYFVQNSPGDLNEHFRSSLAICHPCVVKYTFYPNFRNLSTDIPTMIHQLGLNPKYYQNSSLHRRHHRTRHLLDLYYSQLSHVQKVKLFAKLYEELDFYYHLYPQEYNSHVNILGMTEMAWYL